MKDSLSQITQGIKIAFRSQNAYWVFFTSVVLITWIYYWLFSQATTISTFIQMTKDGEYGEYSYLYSSVYVITTVLTILSFGFSAVLLFWLWRNSKLSRLSTSSNMLGGFVGALASACPVCGAFLLTLLGVTGSLSIFPLLGLELKVLSLGLVSTSVLFAAKKVSVASACESCEVGSPSEIKTRAKFSLTKILTLGLTALFLFNQYLIGQISETTGLRPKGSLIGSVLGLKTAATYSVIAPKLNSDGKTTSLVEQPTISEVPPNPNTRDPVEDAKIVMIPTGKPFYAPEDTSFDDPLNAQKKWQIFNKSLQLTPEQEQRWKGLTNTFTCNYCCGGPNNVTVIARCGCQHSKAWQGFFKYMIVSFGDKYSDDQLKGEAYRWTGIWYPKGVLEDYLLATGKSEAMTHAPHGGAGSDNRHGL